MVTESVKAMQEVDELTFEQARDELRAVIQTLESGSAPLEETLSLWKRGEALATRCRAILEKATAEVEQASLAETPSVDEAPAEPLE